MLFFSELISNFNKGYSNLLGLDEEEDEEQREQEPDGNSEQKSTNDTEIYFSWLSVVDLVSQTIREPWEKVFDMSIYSFFNIWAYSKTKFQKRLESIKNWKNNN